MLAHKRISRTLATITEQIVITRFSNRSRLRIADVHTSVLAAPGRSAAAAVPCLLMTMCLKVGLG